MRGFMIEVNNIKVFNFEGAFRGLRNPMNSWDKSDSFFDITRTEDESCYDVAWNWTIQRNKELNYEPNSDEWCNLFDYFYNWLFENSDILDWPDDCMNARFIGPNDMQLAQRMVGGPEEAKFLRQIMVSMDINAPFFWWKEMDTYKVATTANSCSTMHKLTSREFATQDFSFDKLIENFNPEDQELISKMRVDMITYCEKLRKRYLETKDKRIWRALIEILPSAYMQKRTWTANYQVLRNIYFQRRNHKLQEWRDFCKTIESLPYGRDLICYEKDKT